MVKYEEAKDFYTGFSLFWKIIYWHVFGQDVQKGGVNPIGQKIV